MQEIELKYTTNQKKSLFYSTFKSHSIMNSIHCDSIFLQYLFVC